MRRIICIVILLVVFFISGTHVLATSGIVQTDSLNVREKASTNSNSIGVLEKGKKIDIISEENEWYKIKFENGNGYVKAEYITINDSNNTPEADEENDNSETDIGSESPDNDIGSEYPDRNEENSNDVVESENNEKNYNSTSENSKIIGSSVDLYVLPLVNATKIGVLEDGTEINIISNNGKWLFVQSDNIRGWIISKKIDTIDSTAGEKNEEENVVTNEIVEENTTVEEKVTQESNENKIDESKTSESNNGNYPTTMYVLGDSVNVRKSASTNAEAISGASKNDTIKVIGKEGDWYKVDTEDGIGYIKSELLSSSKN